MAANLTTSLTVQDFTTLASVKELAGLDENEVSLDVTYEKLIGVVSARFVSYLGLHAVQAERTETYELGRGKKVLSLNAKPIDTGQTVTVKLGSMATDFATAGELSDTLYSVNAPGGWLRFRVDTPEDPNHVQVTYTGGLGTSTADLMSNFPDLAYAAELQAKYLVNRRDSLGGNVTVHGTSSGGTSYTGEFRLLKEVREVLDQHARSDP